MYEGLNGVKRLYRALESTDNIKLLANVLRYEPGQLVEDVRALGNYLRGSKQEADTPTNETKTLDFENMPWDDFVELFENDKKVHSTILGLKELSTLCEDARAKEFDYRNNYEFAQYIFYYALGDFMAMYAGKSED